MTGEQQGDELVANLRIAHLAAVVELGGNQHREDVLAFGEVGIGAAGGDLRVELRVHPVAVSLEGPPGPVAGEDPEAHAREADHLPRRGRGLIEQDLEWLPHRPQARLLGDAEDGAQDHLERDALHPRVDPEPLVELPGVDLAIDDLLDHRLIRAHPLAVKGGQHQLAASQVLRPFEEKNRARAHDRLQGRVAARRQGVARVRVDRLCRGRV
jgi:uncharacterized protein involved in copper resistance